jgi:hypothetical protein
MEVSDLTQRRIRVLEIRLRIERIAYDAHAVVCKPEKIATKPHQADSHLSYVLGLVSPDRYMEVHGLIRLARHVYRKSSDILHGRSGLLNAAPVILEEWIIVVEKLESLFAASRLPTQGAAPEFVSDVRSG